MCQSGTDMKGGVAALARCCSNFRRHSQSQSCLGQASQTCLAFLRPKETACHHPKTQNATMWLINAKILKLEYFVGNDIPPYAILSHTWDGGEVSFAEMNAPSHEVKAKEGYSKILQTCRLARQHRLDYAWIDACCIDKSSSAELTESINSMYKWYADAAICFAFLSDLVPLPGSNLSLDVAFRSCRWFTRGWTLQELIAPQNIHFYDKTWNMCGTKKDHSAVLANISGVPKDVLDFRTPVTQHAAATRMSWASKRHTTRVEDMAYCLLGLFGINMPMIYGEGENAFLRLQQEIIQRSNDITILAWDHGVCPMDRIEPETSGIPALASSPAFFEGCDFFGEPCRDVDFTLTNVGLQFNDADLYWQEKRAASSSAPDLEPMIYLLELDYAFTKSSQEWNLVSLPLWKLQPDVFVRRGNLVWEVAQHQEAIHALYDVQLQEPETASKPDQFRFFPSNQIRIPFIKSEWRAVGGALGVGMKDSVHFPPAEGLRIISATPPGHWDHGRQLFYSAERLAAKHAALAVHCALEWKGIETEIAIFIEPDVLTDGDAFPQFRIAAYTQNYKRFFNHDETIGRPVRWYNLSYEWPDIDAADEVLYVDVNGRKLEITADFSYKKHLEPGYWRGERNGVVHLVGFEVRFRVQEMVEEDGASVVGPSETQLVSQPMDTTA